ncbi:MAG: NCS2 family permease, partial [Bacteroidota bacterium]|nr:NCS2 family permease [Bacteroidota bacterium]
PTFCQFDFNGFFSYDTLLVLISLLIVNIFDTVGTLVGLAEKTGVVKSDGTIPHVKEAMMSDAIGTTAGAMLGSSTITTYIESASGIAEGGRTGVTSFVVGLFFIIALFFSPIFMLIPAAATSGALVLVGVLMLDSIKNIDLGNVSEAFPAFITMITMVLCYSIADGICLGILSYVILKLCLGKWRDLNWTLAILSVIFILNFVFG